MKPRYIIDLDKLEETARIAKANADRLGVRLLMALKSFPLPAAFPTLAKHVEGFTCSGLYEAKLARINTPSARSFQVHVHAPAYTDDEIDEICATCSHVVFNSLSQLERFGAAVRAKGCSIGLRLNPGFSSADCLKYDPCCPESRFGVTFDELARWGIEKLGNLGVEGLHIHALCEGYADDFAGLVEKFTEQLQAVAPAFARSLKWINLGGGEVINDPAFATPRAIAAVERMKEVLRPTSNLQPSTSDLAIYIEPSEYMVRYAGFLEAHVLDVIRRGKDIAVLDVSGSCHATDLILFDMKPDVVSPALAETGKRTILGCVSCLAGDVLGEYSFAKPLQVGDTVVFGGLGCYTFAQQSWFNGIRHPDLVLRTKATGERTVLSWDYADYLREFHRG